MRLNSSQLNVDKSDIQSNLDKTSHALFIFGLARMETVP